MALSIYAERDPTTQEVADRIGPDFAWLRVEPSRSLCFVRADDISFPPVALSFGMEALTESFASTIQASPDKASELLRHTVFGTHPECRRLAEPALRPLASRVRQILEGMETHGLTVPTLLIDLHARSSAIVPAVLQDLLPEWRVCTLESLGFRSPEILPVDGSLNEPTLGESPGDPESVEPEAAPVETEEPATPMVQPVRPLDRDYIPPDNTFLAWLAFLAAVAFIGLSLYLWYTMRQVNGRLDSVTVALQRIEEDRRANPGSGAIRPQGLFPAPLPPLPSSSGLPPLSASHGASRSALLLPLPAPGGGTGGGGGRGVSRHGSPGIPGFLPPPPAGALLSALPIPAPSREALTSLPPPIPAGAAPPPATPPETTAPPSPGPDAPAPEMPAPEPPVPEPPPLHAEMSTPLAGEWTLDDLLRRADDRSLTTTAARWRAAAAVAAGDNTLLPYRFQWGLSGLFSTGTNVNSALATNANFSALGLSGGLQLDPTHRRRALKRAAAAGREAAVAGVTAALEEARYTAAAAYLEAVLAAEEVAARREMLTVAREQWRVAKRRKEEGQASRLDLAQAATRVADAQNQVTTATAAQETAEVRLGQAIRVMPGARVRPAGDDSGWISAAAEQIASRPASTLANARADVVQAAAVVEQRRASLDLARRSRDPSINAFGGFSILDSQGTGFSPALGVRLSMPFGDGGQSRNLRREAEASLGEGTILYSTALENAITEIVAAQVEVRRTKQSADATQAAVVAGREAVRASRQRYEAGFSTLTDLMQAETDLDNALRARAAGERSALAAQITLLRAAGRLGSPAPAATLPRRAQG